MRCAIGLMSGTSMDGIDAALIRTDGENAVERGPSHFTPYDEPFRQRIEAGLAAARAITKRHERPGDLAALERELTLRHAKAVRALLEKAGGWAEPEVIGFHGQTVLHRPEAALTVQLGDGDLLSRETGYPVVYDMRANDMAQGGQGAPLVPAYHTALARSLGATLASPAVFVNIGGISNITYVPAAGDPIAFDTGPGNGLIDQWVKREAGVPFDENGAIAARGETIEPVVAGYLQNPFFARPGPKSLDRADFTLARLEGMSLANGARTLAAVSAHAILAAVDHLPSSPKTWVLCGGGRKNPHIVADLRHGASQLGSAVLLSEEVGLDGDATEAEAWAYLAVRSLRGLPLTWPTTTGCREAVSGGVVAGLPPASVRKKARLLGDSASVLRSWPFGARKKAGFQIYLVELGSDPDARKPMRSIGPGVREIRIRDREGAYRIIYVASFAETVYVLHAFQKKTEATPQRDLEVAKRRLRELQQGLLR